MKKILLISISFFLILISCSQRNQKIQVENDVDKFLNLFKPLTTDKLVVNSTEYLTDTTEYEFRGKVIDTCFYSFIKDRYLNLGLNKYSDDRYYACYKRKLNDSTFLLIMRTPYEYWESSVKLYLFDLKSLETADYIEAAQNWGDAGDYLEKYSILENLKIKTYKKTCWILNEETMESDCTDSIHDYRIKGHKFILEKKTELKK